MLSDVLESLEPGGIQITTEFEFIQWVNCSKLLEEDESLDDEDFPLLGDQ